MFLKDTNEELEDKDLIQTALNIRMFIIILELPGLYEQKNYEFLFTVLKKALRLRKEVADIYVRWISDFNKERFERLFIRLREVLSNIVI